MTVLTGAGAGSRPAAGCWAGPDRLNTPTRVSKPRTAQNRRRETHIGASPRSFFRSREFFTIMVSFFGPSSKKKMTFSFPFVFGRPLPRHLPYPLTLRAARGWQCSRRARYNYVETPLMHCTEKASGPTDRSAVMDTLADYKAKGKIRNVGVSCHGMAPLKSAVDCDWIDVDPARINPVVRQAGRMDGAPQEVAGCPKAMHAKGKGISCFESPQQIDPIVRHPSKRR